MSLPPTPLSPHGRGDEISLWGFPEIPREAGIPGVLALRRFPEMASPAAAMDRGEPPKAGKEGRLLVTFDVDGTLLRSTGGPSSNRLHRQAFSHAFLRVFGIPDATIDVMQHHGQTDPIILVQTLVHYGISYDLATEKLPDLISSMISYAREHVKDIDGGLELLPGVASLLEALSQRENVAIGLVTGNLEDIAWMKMEGLGIRKYFTTPNFGGFGSDHSDRGELVKIAVDRATKLFPGGFDLRVHVGDTPNDIKAAEHGGALAIGVCTGIFSEKELREASRGDAVVLSDLSDSNAFMNLLGIKK